MGLLVSVRLHLTPLNKVETLGEGMSFTTLPDDTGRRSIACFTLHSGLILPSLVGHT